MHKIISISLLAALTLMSTVHAAETKKEKVNTPLAKYTHVNRVGDLYFLAGKGSRDPNTNKYVGIKLDEKGEIESYDIKAQTQMVLDNIVRVLKNQGLTKKDIVEVTVYLKDMKDYKDMNIIWNTFFEGMKSPSRTTVSVKGLPGQNFVEMKAIASKAKA